MGVVIDMFTREVLTGEQDTEQNDHIANNYGRYLGVLPKKAGESFRDEAEQLQSRKEQIDRMEDQWVDDFTIYQTRLVNTLEKLKMLPKGFDPLIHHVFIDEEGHVFMVDYQSIY